MKFMANIRAKWTQFDEKYLTDLRYKYSNLNVKQKQIVKGIIIIVCVFLFYLIVHYGYMLMFGHKQWVRTPMMVRHGHQIEIPQGSPLRAQLELKTIELSDKPHVIHLPGWVEAIPTQRVEIFPPLSGRLISINVDIGDKVKAGQVLATMSAPDLAGANADYQKALSAYTLAETILKRAQSVNQIGGNSAQVVQQAKNDALQAESELNRAKTRLKTLSQQLFKSKVSTLSSQSKDADIFQETQITLKDLHTGMIRLRSPINGRITALNYGVGSYINDLTDPLMTVVDLHKVWVTAHVPETVIAKIHKGQVVGVTFLAYPHEVYRGRIRFTHPELNPDTRRNLTRIELSNTDGRLQPNMFANINVQVEEPGQIMIPLSSVLMNNESTVVYVESSPWVCQKREVELGTEDGEFIRVLSGLKPGERIVTRGGVFINDK